MNKCYRIHPEEYELGENERFYEQMAAKGWLLEKRGAWWSKFRKGNPEKRQYRIEFSPAKILEEEEGLPEEQVELYQESGWDYVCGSGRMHVFSTKGESDLVEIYTDPRQQAPTLKPLLRGYVLSFLMILLLLGIDCLLTVSISGNDVAMLSGLETQFQRAWVEATAVVLTVLCILLLVLYTQFYGAIAVFRLYRNMKKGIPVNHQAKRPGFHVAVRWSLLGLCAVFLVLSVVQWFTIKDYPMPETSDGPYVMLEELGISGNREENWQGEESSVETGRSLAAEYWNTREYVSKGEKSWWIYQDIYCMPTAEQAENYAHTLMRDALFARGEDGFQQRQVEGLDIAYESWLEYVAVKENWVYFITYSAPEIYESDSKGDQHFLEQYASVLNNHKEKGD